ncbi:MAG TPA: hypothetical protein IAA60_02180 [Candidatus Ornithomonoglobus intestinigallinarum]|uniref:RND related barrel-sandwich hybrid domain-containing protein n=1 Tax=Candidatus Ornithomonoglobus intestinigallinarum TaxID=2840894 RepID=A0A9D1KNM8_9FIRM|nr:hypothetical protein [Candidatus Ornithomonoglobus intestinigallinarum]
MTKKIILGVFAAAALFFTAWGAWYVSSPVNSADVVTETVEHFVSDNDAVIIRDEQVCYSDIGGTIYSSVSEGERVAKDSLICTVFGGAVSADNLNELRMLDKKIERQSQSLNESSEYAEGADTESRINSMLRSVADAGRRNDIMRIADYKEDINSLRSGAELSDEELLQSLVLEKQALEERISADKFDVTAGMPGIYMTYTDGLETALSPENIESYTPSAMSGLMIAEPVRLAQGTVEEGGVVCKIANNHVWYAALTLSEADAEQCEEGAEVTLRFNSAGGQTVGGTIYFISEPEADGSRLAVVRCPEYFADAFSYRTADIDMIFESYTGVRLPIYALRSDEGGRYAVGMKGSAEYKCYCEVLYTDTENEFVIIKSIDTSPVKAEDMDRIIIGER